MLAAALTAMTPRTPPPLGEVGRGLEWLARSFVDAGQEVSESERMMQNFIQLVKNNIDNPDLKISFLCKELLVTEATLGRKVKAYTGQSVGRYITSIRMAVARQLLKESGLNISEIAYRVGYQDPNTISRYFKKDAGISPSGFRKRRKL